MATIVLKTSKACAVSLNNNFILFLEPDKSYTLPIPTEDCYFSATSVDGVVSHCFIKASPYVHLLPCESKLYKWSDDIYELIFSFLQKEDICFINKESPFINGSIGLLGRNCIFEYPNGKQVLLKKNIEDFTVFSSKAVLLKEDSNIYLINENFEETVFSCAEFFIKDNILTITFNVGDLDFITFTKKYNKNLECISTDIQEGECNSAFDSLRLFAQSVRLNLRKRALEHLTPSLREEMSFESIQDFLGVFDQTDTVKYAFNQRENTLALRYKVDDCNYHYICYEFTLSKTNNTILIDDIGQL